MAHESPWSGATMSLATAISGCCNWPPVSCCDGRLIPANDWLRPGRQTVSSWRSPPIATASPQSFTQAVDGNDEAQLVVPADASGHFPNDWSRDGQIITHRDRAKGVDLWIASAAGGDKPHALIEGPERLRAPACLLMNDGSPTCRTSRARSKCTCRRLTDRANSPSRPAGAFIPGGTATVESCCTWAPTTR